MKHYTLVLFSVVVLSLLFVGRALAADFVITGNGSGSTNSISGDYTTNTTVTQTNQGGATNNINATANTGGNNSNGGSILTGDATTNVNVTNNFNSNNATVKCCTTPTPKPSGEPGNPTPPTGGGDGGGSNSGGGGSSSGGGGSSSGGSGGQVMGLSATAGESSNVFYVLGSLCLAFGSVLLGTKKFLA